MKRVSQFDISIKSEADLLAERAKELEGRVSLSKACIESVKFDILNSLESPRIHLVLDSNVLIYYFFPFLRLESGKEVDFLYEQLVLRYLFDKSAIRKVIVAPYAAEYRRFYEDYRRRIVDSLNNDAKTSMLAELVCDRFSGFEMLRNKLKAASTSAKDMNRKIVGHFAAVLTSGRKRFWEAWDKRKLLALKDVMSTSSPKLPETQDNIASDIQAALDKERPRLKANNRKDVDCIELIRRLNLSQMGEQPDKRMYFLHLSADKELSAVIREHSICLEGDSSSGIGQKHVSISRELFHLFLLFSFFREGENRDTILHRIEEFEGHLRRFPRVTVRLSLARLSAKWAGNEEDDEVVREARELYSELEAVLNEVEDSPAFPAGVASVVAHVEEGTSGSLFDDGLPENIESAVEMLVAMTDDIHEVFERSMEEAQISLRELEVLIAHLGVPEDDKYRGCYYKTPEIPDSEPGDRLIRAAVSFLEKRDSENVANALDILLKLRDDPSYTRSPLFYSILMKAYRLQGLHDDSLGLFQHARHTLGMEDPEMYFEAALAVKSTRQEPSEKLRKAFDYCDRACEMVDNEDPRFIREWSFLAFCMLSTTEVGSDSHVESVMSEESILNGFERALSILTDPNQYVEYDKAPLMAHLHNDIAYMKSRIYSENWAKLLEALGQVNESLTFFQGRADPDGRLPTELSSILETKGRVLFAMWQLRLSQGKMVLSLLREIHTTVEYCQGFDTEGKCARDLKDTFLTLFADIPAHVELSDESLYP